MSAACSSLPCRHIWTRLFFKVLTFVFQYSHDARSYCCASYELWMRTNEQTGAKNHFNFRLHDQIDTIKQTDKNNDHIQRNKTNEPVTFKPSEPHRKRWVRWAWNLFWRKLPSFGGGQRSLSLNQDGWWLQEVEIISDRGKPVADGPENAESVAIMSQFRRLARNSCRREGAGRK